MFVSMLCIKCSVKSKNFIQKCRGSLIRSLETTNKSGVVFVDGDSLLNICKYEEANNTIRHFTRFFKLVWLATPIIFIFDTRICCRFSWIF